MTSEKVAKPTNIPKPLSPLEPIGDSDSTVHVFSTLFLGVGNDNYQN